MPFNALGIPRFAWAAAVAAAAALAAGAVSFAGPEIPNTITVHVLTFYALTAGAYAERSPDSALGRMIHGAGHEIQRVLSTREREVFRLAAECLLTREIARELCISRKTVDTHLYRIHRKLGLRTSAELVRLASSLGMVHAGRTRDVSAIRCARSPR